MDPISSNPDSGAALYAMKKAMEVQGQGILKVLESAQISDSSSPSGSGASVTGIGQNLDIRA